MSQNIRRSVRNGEQQVPATALLSIADVLRSFLAWVFYALQLAGEDDGLWQDLAARTWPASTLCLHPYYKTYKVYCVRYSSRIW